MKNSTYEDQIRIEELEVYAHHGVYPEENEKGQHFYVNATLYTNTRPAGLADDLSLSTNYGEVCQFITEFMQQHTFQLIETVAERTAYEVLQHFPLVQGLDLEIRKPEAPIPLPFGSVSVAIHREWHEAYIAVGSNMGDSREHIARALGQLKNSKNIRVEKVSNLLETLECLRSERCLHRKNYYRSCIVLSRWKEENVSFTGAPGHWIWILFSMMT